MKVRIEKTFPLSASADTAWALLQDIEAVAACMPGARITERIDAQHYKGSVSVAFGPASMSFRGEVEVVALEAADKTLRLLGKGTDATGSSGASMDLTARLEAVDATSCKLVGSSDVSVSGKAAAFGGRMMSAVADQVLKQFADNFVIRVQAAQALNLQAGAPTAATGADAGQRSAVAASLKALASLKAVAPLNALALLWAMIKDWLRARFAAKRP